MRVKMNDPYPDLYDFQNLETSKENSLHNLLPGKRNKHGVEETTSSWQLPATFTTTQSAMLHN